MNELSVHTEVDAPAGRVWELVTDLERSPDIISAIDEVEVLAGEGAFGLGTKWRETRTMFGRQATEVMEVTKLDPGRSYTVEADGKGAHYVSTMSVEPLSDDRSKLSFDFSGEPQGALGKVMAATVGRFFAGATRKAMEQDLSELKAAAEAK